jgi:chromatin assembly factor 1 subunit A
LSDVLVPYFSDELEGVGEDIKEDEAHTKMKHRAKLLLFKENRRPAFYGTWRKKSKSILARRPFAQDPVSTINIEFFNS